MKYVPILFSFSLCFFIIGCSATVNMASSAASIKTIDQSVDQIKELVVYNKKKLTDDEFNVLKEAYKGWKEIIKELDNSGCGILHIGSETCSLSIYQVRRMHEQAKGIFENVEPIAIKHYDELTTQEKSVLEAFSESAKIADKSMIEFEEDPDADTALRVLKDLSMFAKMTRVIVPIVIGAM